MNRIKYTIDRNSISAVISIIFMALSAAIRIIYFTFSKNDIFTLLTQFVLPVSAAIIFIIILRNEKLELTFISVVLGVAFFMIKAFTFDTLIHTVLCLILYTAVLVLYGLTIFGIIKTKYLLYPLFGLPLLYHIFVEDMQAYVFAQPKIPFFEWLPEISVLCIMAALLCVSIALKKK